VRFEVPCLQLADERHRHFFAWKSTPGACSAAPRSRMKIPFTGHEVMQAQLDVVPRQPAEPATSAR
jgi:hypothetical protein